MGRQKHRERQKGRNVPEWGGSRHGEARAEPGGRASPAAELRALPRRPLGPTRPRPARLSLGRASPSLSLLAARLLPRKRKPRRVGGPAPGAGLLPGYPVPRPRPRPRRPQPPGFPGSAAAPPHSARGRRAGRGRGAAPAAEASGSRAPSCRLGRDLPRAAAAVGSAVRPPVPAELSAGRRGQARRPQGGSRRRPAGLAAAPRGSAGLRCAPSAAPGGRAVRGSGEPSGSDVRGVSAPNRERGRGQRREGRAKERAGGRAGPLPPGAQEGAPRPPGAPAPSPHPALEPRAGLRRGPTARRSCRGRPGRRPRDREESRHPGAFKAPSAGFLCAGTSLRLTFPEPGPPGDEDGGVPFGGNRALLPSCSENVAFQSTEPPHEGRSPANLFAPGRATGPCS